MLLFVFTSILAFGQEEAKRYMDLFTKGEYAEVVDYFEKQYRSNATNYYETLRICYIGLKRYDDAESLIKKQQRKTKNKILFIDLGYVQQLQKQEAEALESYNLALEAIQENPNLAHQYSEKFSSLGLYPQALKAYEIAERMNPNVAYHYQKGLLYAEMGDLENMYAEYLEMISQSPTYYANIQQRISNNISDDPENESNLVLKRQLIKKIQESQNILFTNLLIWLYIEEAQYGQAFRQLKALDKRNENQEPQIFSLGEKALSADDYNIALECFSYLEKKGPMGFLYEEAIYNKLATLREQTQANPEAKKADYEKLVREHYAILPQLMGNEKYVYTKRDIAKMLNFNLALSDSAISSLQKTIAYFGEGYKKPVAECKMMLGDILLGEGKSIDALFKYMEVERAYNGTPLGDDAKFQKGMVAYYTADFPWALSQFEVLKSSSTKLISNDALQMALLISDNSTEDTLYQGLTYYAKADLFRFRNLLDSAVYTLDLLLAVFPDHAIKEEAMLLKGEILYQEAKYNEAVETLETMLANSGGDVWADDALMLLGRIYANAFGDKNKAMQAYEKILFEHPGSTYVPEARRMYRALRGDNLSN